MEEVIKLKQYCMENRDYGFDEECFDDLLLNLINKLSVTKLLIIPKYKD